MASPSNPLPGSARLWTNENLKPEALQSLRVLGDPLADDVIAELFADGGLDAMNALMRDFVANEHPVPVNLPDPIRRYLEQSHSLPAWADLDKIRAGEDVFWRFGPRIILILTCYSLPFCYLGQHGVPVLALTNRLSSNPKRRIVETAQMIVDVLQQGGLTSPGGRGLLTIQKVRLMHAAIRHLAPGSPSYKSEFGLPVNQEDLLGTMLSFSWIGVDGLDKIGVKLTPEDQEAYIHCWNIVGHLLGIHDELLPSNVTQAKMLADGIAAHQFGPTEEGKALTSALVEMMAHVLPGNVFDRVPALMIRYFLGQQWAAWLGIEGGALAGVVAEPLRILGVQFGGVLEDSKTIAGIAERMGKLLIESIVYVERGGNRPSFTIPGDLRQQWGVNWTS